MTSISTTDIRITANEASGEDGHEPALRTVSGLHLGSFKQNQGILSIHAKVSHRALERGVPEEDVNGS